LATKREPAFVELDVNATLTKAVDLCKIEARAKRITLISDLRSDLPKVRGDSVLIEQVVICLLMNALEAHQAEPTDVEACQPPTFAAEQHAFGEAAPPLQHRVTLSTQYVKNSHIEISVADTGAGIPTEQLEQVFEPFFSTKSGGMGMGLAVSRSIVESHGGKIYCDSAPGMGAIFRFTLPLSDARSKR
jgi:signal transduction histidine kinase